MVASLINSAKLNAVALRRSFGLEGFGCRAPELRPPHFIEGRLRSERGDTPEGAQ
jgi:hypothetical protein